jgi:hypothetical protein
MRLSRITYGVIILGILYATGAAQLAVSQESWWRKIAISLIDRKASPPGNPAECIHSQHFAGVTWMFSFKPFLESRYVAVATRGPGTVHFIATFATTNRTSHAL